MNGLMMMEVWMRRGDDVADSEIGTKTYGRKRLKIQNPRAASSVGNVQTFISSLEGS